MRTIDFSPLFRSSIGFDRMQRLFDSAMQVDPTSLSYPPYNIEATGEDSYRITMAVAGFSEDDLEVVVRENTLTITGKAVKDPEGVAYLHRGIAGRSFERRFELAEHIKVAGGSMDNGMLHLDLVRDVPEEKKPRRIEIGTAGKLKAIGKKAA